jgi:DNA-binding NarL/FixJ family response regulator
MGTMRGATETDSEPEAVTAKVLIVDDHPLMRRGLEDMLSGEPDLEICGQAHDVAEALKLVKERRPDLAILDISLPSGSGIDLIKRIHSIDSTVKVLFLSMHDETVFAERALRAGALGYIQKSRPSEELLEAIRTVAQGEIALSRKTADRLVRKAVGAPAGQSTPMARLSDRELEIFEMIGKGLTTGEIAERLKLSVKTVETHREHIKKRLEVQSGAKLSRLAILWTQEQA